MATAVSSILETSLHHFHETADRLGLDAEVREKIQRPKETIEVNVNPVLPNGRMAHVRCFIVIHNDALGPAKGGIRMTADVSLGEVAGLAMEMTWKTALVGVPFGGGKSGIQFDPASISPAAKEAIVRSFTRGSTRHLGPEIYIPAPDMGMGEGDMAHIRDCIAYSRGTAITNGCFVTGKPVILGGIVGRREATGKGVVYTIEALCRRLGLSLGQLRVAVQGFGNVGSVAAAAMAQRGCKIVAVSDISGGVCNSAGLDVSRLQEHVVRHGAIAGFGGGRAIAREEVLTADCDVLIPAAAGSQITSENVEQIKARIIAEAANAPTTPKADEALRRRDVQIIPDILCNAGGVFVSYLEYTQETQREQMTLDEVERRLAERMRQRLDEVYEFAQQDRLSMREAAMNLAVSRVVEATYARGFLP